MVNINDCRVYIDKYISWLNSNFIIEYNKDFCHIITPFLRQDHDHIEIFIEVQNDTIIISDDGLTFEYLLLSNIDINTPSRKQYLNSICKRTNTFFDGYALKSFVKSLDDFPLYLNNFINASMSICNLTYTSFERSKTTFRDNIKSYLDSKNVPYRNLSITGYSKTYKLDFVIIKPKPIYIEPISAASTSYGQALAERVAFQWYDLRRNNNQFIGVSLINDEDDIWTKDILKILEDNSDVTISWSERDKLLQLIA
ncbi:DUF1828 domain-containing protein [Caloramator sp. Dgby_cultured_2]|uniref:DUF1828 domain-containing protein n=1 Tax=Caloramator sp. Dgby_cultured_2 TaxID=3029174 RepID=UPI00237E5A13|nr:DUF1828 domain-containing protein [Caloramator sp. Dgby_cultured_2]WDU82317.1 DUF1828 domain-containing protein [Caloramator sp. Dgby_cultured_2]